MWLRYHYFSTFSKEYEIKLLDLVARYSITMQKFLLW
jgi:hypothetical protein